MPGGRPARNDFDSYPELVELAAWFRQAITDCGYTSVNAFVQQHILDKNKVYDLVRGKGLLSLDSTRRLAGLLKRDPAEVELIWLRAREARDLQLMAEDERVRPRVASWAEIPRPELTLRNVLDGLTNVTEQLPYRLIGVTPPPLSTVFVRQRLRGNASVAPADAPKERDRPNVRATPNEQASAEVLVTLVDALNRSEHLLVTGEPGAGKSTLGHQLISQLARIWLRQESAANPPLHEPVVPLRVSARSLASGGSWSTVLARATIDALGPHLVTEPSQQLFAGRTHGARWLIVVDGLDEILDRPTRTSVIRALGQHARIDSEYRFVITTRPLPDDELAPLSGIHVGTCRIEPFEQEELRLFAQRWFLSQDPITAEQRSEDFLDQVADGRLRELVSNPLLASIAAVAYTREPDRPLPVNRIDLYQRFYEYLVTDEEASGRDTPTEIRRFQEGQPARYRLAEWMHSQRIRIIDEMAKERLAADTPITDVACSWVQDNKPETLELPLGWQADLDRLLIDTGMFVYESSGLRFLHHTFAEFLAARAYAAKIPEDFPERETWFERGLKPAERNFALLTLASWGRSKGNDIGIILRSLLDGSRDRSLLAGRLLAECSDTDARSNRLVVDRLINLALGSALDGGESYTFAPTFRPRRLSNTLAGASEAFEIIGLLNGNQYASERLRQVLSSAEIPFLTRFLALSEITNVESKRAALPLLPILQVEAHTPLERLIIAGLHSELNDGIISDDLRLELLDIEEDPSATSEHMVAVATGLMEGGYKEAAIEACWAVLGKTGAHSIDIQSATEMILTHSVTDENFDPETIKQKLAGRDSGDCAAAAKELLDAGYVKQAKAMAWDVLKEDSTATTLSMTLEVLFHDASKKDAQEVLERVRARSDWKDERAQLLERILEAGHVEFVVAESLEVIQDAGSGGYDTELAVRAWISAVKPDTVDELVEILQLRTDLDAWTRANASGALADSGFLPEAIEMARPVFLDPRADDLDLREATKVMRQAEPSVVAELVRSVSEPHPERVTDLARMVQTLRLLENTESAKAAAFQLLVHRQVDLTNFQVALDAIISTQGVSAADKVVEALSISAVPERNRLTAADRLAYIGALDQAATLWTSILTSPSLSAMDSFAALTRLVWTGNRHLAIEALRTTSAKRDIPPGRRARINGLLAWALCSDPRSNEDAELTGSSAIDGSTPGLQGQ
ncbi:NACHT domain-containing protein [Streptomyces sp. cg28]|uniref:NACHT domain-containing protein n=1 Tax=Streptomyces sp. cg28 TaxID=3403457 RepID=UPI003B20ED5F